MQPKNKQQIQTQTNNYRNNTEIKKQQMQKRKRNHKHIMSAIIKQLLINKGCMQETNQQILQTNKRATNKHEMACM